MLYTHRHGHKPKIAVTDACSKVDILKVTFEMTTETCKLVKESPQKSNRYEERRKTTKNQAKTVHSFCPTRWAVCSETLDLITNNYDELMSIWTCSLQELTNTEMKAWIHGATSRMKKNKKTFGCRLGATILNQKDKLNRTLQKPTLYAVEAHDIALKVLAVLRKEQSD